MVFACDDEDHFLVRVVGFLGGLAPLALRLAAGLGLAADRVAAVSAEAAVLGAAIIDRA